MRDIKSTSLSLSLPLSLSPSVPFSCPIEPSAPAHSDGNHSAWLATTELAAPRLELYLERKGSTLAGAIGWLAAYGARPVTFAKA